MAEQKKPEKKEPSKSKVPSLTERSQRPSGHTSNMTARSSQIRRVRTA
jgi:hypothetical protein